MGKKSLLAISSERDLLIQELIESEGAIDQFQELALERNAADLAEKIDNYKLMFDRIKLNTQYFKDRKKEYETALKQLASLEDRLKKYVKLAMGEDTDFVGNDFRFKKSQAKPKVIIDDPDFLPQEYMREKVVVEPDKEKINEALSRGEEIPGVRLEENYTLRSYINKGIK